VTQILAKALDKDPNALITLQLLERLSPEWQDMYWAVLNVWGVKTDTEAGMTLEKIRAAMLMAQQAAQLPQGESVKYFLPVLEEPPDVPHDGTELTPDDLKSDHLMEVPPDLSRGAQYVLRARGTAYADIGAWPGDYLLIGRTGTRTGYSVLVKIGDVVTARRYYEQPKPFQLEPAFLNGMPIDHRKVVFLGVVHGLIRHM
jgi:hypothetical protein